MWQGWIRRKLIKLDRIETSMLENQAGAWPRPRPCIKNQALESACDRLPGDFGHNRLRFDREFPSPTGYILISVRFSFIAIRYILQIPLKGSAICLKPQTWTGDFSNSTSSSVTSGRIGRISSSPLAEPATLDFKTGIIAGVAESMEPMESTSSRSHSSWVRIYRIKTYVFWEIVSIEL